MRNNYHNVLAEKLTEALTVYYANCAKATWSGRPDYFPINEKLVEKIEQLLKDYKINKEKYGK